MPKGATEKTKSAPRPSLNLRLVLSLAVLIALSAIFYQQTIENPDCTKEFRQDSVILTPNDTRIAVEIVADQAAQAKGLSGRKCIAENWGMLFSFTEAGDYKFWMKDMKFPIDIVWIDENFKIVDIDRNIKPETYPEAFTSPLPSTYVLEIGAGLSEKYGLVPESTVTF